MRHRALGQTGLQVSEIGFGGIPIRQVASQDEATRVVRRALELGLTFFDTGRSYGNSEELIGNALHGAPDADKCIIATKCHSSTAEQTAEHIDASLKALRRDKIDLYQMHLIADSADLKTRMGPGGALEALLAAREAGKIDHIGITGHRIQALVEGVRRHEVVETVQVPFNMVEDDPLKELIPLCLKRQVGVIAMKPVGGGNLAGPGLIGKSTRASLALRWVLSYPVSSAIPGMRTVAEVEENVPIGSGSLDIPDEEEDMLDVLKADLSARTCRRCDYCMPCPQGIQLSVLLRLKSMVQRIGAESVITPRLVEQVAVAETCVRCETCVGKCPYDLPIPDLLQEEIDWLRTREDYCALEK